MSGNSEFIPNTEYFGGYAYIKTDFSEASHIYKIVNVIQSNFYCDVPIKYNSEPYTHRQIEEVLNVIHCGIDETKVVRVAIKDCDKVIPPTVVKHGKWKYLPETINTVSCFECSNCQSIYDVGLDVGNTRYCPNCGARMDGE